jgi:hypothetical protein
LWTIGSSADGRAAPGQVIQWERTFVTSQGTVYSQFKRALERGNFMVAWTMAAELPKVPLADGLELLLLAQRP